MAPETSMSGRRVLLDSDEEMHQQEAEKLYAVNSHLTGMTEVGPTLSGSIPPSAALVLPAETSGTPVLPSKKRKRLVDQASNVVTDEKAAPTKRKKHELQSGEMAVDMPEPPIPGLSLGYAYGMGSYPEHSTTAGGSGSVARPLPMNASTEGTLSVTSKAKSKGKGKGKAKATEEDNPFTWRPLTTGEFQDANTSLLRTDVGVVKAEYPSVDVQSESLARTTPVQRKPARPRKGLQPTVPITEILDLEPGPEDKLVKCNQTWKVAQNSLPISSTNEVPGPSSFSLSKGAANRNQTTLKPHVWASSRNELYATIPALAPAKGTNSVHWANCDTPIVMLDDHGQSIRAVEMVPVKRSSASDCVFDLILTRKLVPAAASSKKNLAPVIDLTQDDDEVSIPAVGPSNLMDTLESKPLLSFDDTAQTGFRILSLKKEPSLPPLLRSTSVQQPYFPLSEETPLESMNVDGAATVASQPALPEANRGLLSTTDPSSSSTLLEDKESSGSVEHLHIRQELGAHPLPAAESMKVDSWLPPQVSETPIVKNEVIEPTLDFANEAAPSASAPLRAKGKGKRSKQASENQTVRRSARTRAPKAQPQVLPTIPRRPRTTHVKLEEVSISLSQSMLGPSSESNSSQSSTSTAAMSTISAPPALERSRDRPSLWLDTSIPVIDLTMDSPLTSLSTPASPLSPLPALYDAPGPVTAPPVAGPSKSRPLTRREAARQGGAVEFTHFVQEKRARGPNRPKSEGAVTAPEPEKKRRTRGKRKGGFAVKPYNRAKIKVEAQEQALFSTSQDPQKLENKPRIVETGDIIMDDPVPDSIPATAIKSEQGEPSLTELHQTDVASAQAEVSLPSLPMEIKVLVDSFISGYPISIIASHDRMLELLPDDLKPILCKEFTLGYLGFFNVLGLEEKQVPATQEDSKVQHPTFRWKFRVKWISGGEQSIRRDDLYGVSAGPWWQPQPGSPVRMSLENVVKKTSEGTSSVLSTQEAKAVPLATPRLYLKAQEAHPNYPLLDLLSQQTSSLLVPNPLLVDLKCCQSDETFPTGWLCLDCGKVNFQLTMRHRHCTSNICLKNKTPPQHLVRELVDVRGPHGASPVCLPFNEYSKGNIKAIYTAWDNGMKTFSYYFDQSSKKQVVKHLFTSNVSTLQNRATALFLEVQRDIQLKRIMDDSANPYFTANYDVTPPVTPTALRTGIPDCLMRIQELISSRVTFYAELSGDAPTITKFDIMGWVSAGSRKNSSDVIMASQAAVVILSLGCDVVLTLSPLADSRTRSTKSKKGKKEQPQDSLNTAASTSTNGVNAPAVPGEVVKVKRGRSRKVPPPADPSQSVMQKRRGRKPKSHLPEPSDRIVGAGTEPDIAAIAITQPTEPQPAALATPPSELPASTPSMEAKPVPAEEPTPSCVPPKMRKRNKLFVPVPIATPANEMEVSQVANPESQVKTAQAVEPKTQSPPPASMLQATFSQGTVPEDQGKVLSNRSLVLAGNASANPAVPLSVTTLAQSASLSPLPPIPSAVPLHPLPSVDSVDEAALAPRTVQLTLVHGDVVVISGCDLEYSLKRLGPSILIFGSSTS